MADPLKAATLFQRTCLNVDHISPACVVDIPIPSNASFFPSGNSPKRRRIERAQEPLDENSFSRLYLASEANIYFRPHKTVNKKRKSETSQLKSVLWRILDNRTCLELQSVELCQDAKQKDALLTLRLNFENKIRLGGVALAEATSKTGELGHETPLTLFVVSVIGELFMIILTRSMFVKTNETAGRDLQEWCLSYRPSAFTYRTPFRILATDDTELWFALSDGGLLKLEKSVSDENSTWRETFFTEGVWKASLKGLIPWTANRTMNYDGIDLDLKAATSIACSPDGKHIWAVCLDHTLKAWSVLTGKIVVNRDLDNDSTRDLQKPTDHVIDPVQSNLLRIYSNESAQGEYTLLTFSPKSREFKIWSIRDANDGDNGVLEKRAGARLVPPIEDLTDTTVWTLENFFLETLTADWIIWISVRSGAQTHIYSVTFDITNTTQDLQRQWIDNWAIVHPGLNTTAALKSNAQNPFDIDLQMEPADSESVTERWLTYLSFPGRFSTSELETALNIYQNGIGQRSRQTRGSPLTNRRPVFERICSTIGSTVPLEFSSQGTMAYDQFSKNLVTQWQMFHGVLMDLHLRREVSLAFAFDTCEGTPWLVMADFIAPSRKCSELEILWHNRDTFAIPRNFKPGNLLLLNIEEADPGFGQFLHVVDVFRNCFSKSFLNSFQVITKSKILEDTALSMDDPIKVIYDQSGFEGQVSDDDYETFIDAMETIGGFANINDSIFDSILEFLNERFRGHPQKQELTKYGAMAVVRGAHETLSLGIDVLQGLLLLVVFMDQELEASDVANMIEDFHPRKIFDNLAIKIKEYSVLSWLADNTRPVTKDLFPNASGSEIVRPNSVETEKPSITLLESIFIGDWANMPFPNGLQSILLTYWCRAWVFGSRLSQNYDGVTTYVMGNLLKNYNLSLAFGFLQYLPRTPWATYLRGRVYLAASETADAAIFFKQAAEGLAIGKFLDLDQYDRAGLLTASEHKSFNNGLPSYYNHVITLYNNYDFPSYAADFAQLALTALPALPSPGSSKYDDAAALRSRLLMHLFNAALSTSQYTLAHAALAQYPDADHIHPSLKKLTSALLAAGRVDTLLSLPFAPDLAAQVDDVLAGLVAKASSTHSSTAPAALRRIAGAGFPVWDYWKVLYSWRVQHNDFRGAALVLWERVQMLKHGSTAQSGLIEGLGTWAELSEAYVMLVTVLSLVEPKWAWILARPRKAAHEGSLSTVENAPDGDVKALGSLRKTSSPALDENGEVAAALPGAAKRYIVTLADVRREWQEELDRRADIEAGRFAFGLGDSDEQDHGNQIDQDGDVFD